jgi:hypothetical protein
MASSEIILKVKFDLSSEDRNYLDTLQALKDRNVQSMLSKCATSGCQNPAETRNEIHSSLYGVGPVNFYICDICHSDYKASVQARQAARY